MDRSVFVGALGEIFEHAPWVAENVYGAQPFIGVNALYDAMGAAGRSAPTERQMALITGHPDLAGKASREGAITADSRREQSSAGLDRLTDEEFALFHKLNSEYHAKFA